MCNTAGLNGGRIPSKNLLLMSLARYPEKLAGKYRQKCREPYADLHEHACVYLNNDLHLDLNNKLFEELNREKFEKLFLKSLQKSFAVLFE